MTVTTTGQDGPPSLAGLTPLLRELNDLKRVRAAHFDGSFAARLFASAWQQLFAGDEAATVALRTTARAIVATRLAGIDAAALATHGVSGADAVRLFEAAFDDVSPAVPTALRDRLRATLPLAAAVDADGPELPAFVDQLIRQPRAGATHPGKPRMILEPAESHADHCLLVAVYAVLVSPRFGGDPGTAFLTGLAHHLFNGSLPDAGFNGDVVMRNAGVLDRITAAAFEQAYAQLPPALADRVRSALAYTRQVDPPVSRCFHAADVFDRVLEMAWFDRCASFTLGRAVRDLDIVHVAPEQAVQRQALAEAGVWHEWP